jgi:hypothetical protein
MQVDPQSPSSDSPGIRLGIGCVALIATLLATAGLGANPARTLVLLLLVVAAACVRTSTAAGAAVGALGWALYTGFVVHRYGQLSAGTEDLARAVLLVGAGALSAAVTTRLRSLPHHGRSH